MENPGFVPPDLTHPAEWLAAGMLALQGGAWGVTALGAFGLVLAALAWATRREGGGPVEASAAGYARLLAALPRVGLAVAMLSGAVAACGTLANRGHHDEMRARAKVLENYPDVKTTQYAPRLGHVEAITYKERRQVDGKWKDVDAVRHEERFHHLAGSDVRAEIRRRPDPVHDGLDRFAVDFKATYKVTNALDRDQAYFLEVSPPDNVNVVHDFAVEADGKALSPQTEGGTRYFLTLPAHGQRDVVYRYKAEGVPRWVYDASAARLSNFKLTIASDVRNVKYASGVAPTAREPWEGGEALTWAYPANASVTEPLGIFTAAGDLGPAGMLPRWLLLAPALLGLWLLVLAATTRLTARDMGLAAVLFGAAVMATYVGGRTFPPALAWVLAGALVVWLAGHLDEDAMRARVATALGLVLPGAALALGHAALALTLAGFGLAAWLAMAGPARTVNLERAQP